MTVTPAPPERIHLAGSAGPALSTVDAVNRTIDARLYDGGPIDRSSGWSGDSYQLFLDPKGIDLSRVAAGSCPLVDSHSTHSISSQFGTVTDIWTKGAAVFGRFRISSRPDAEGVWQDLRDGTRRGVSMGVILLESSDEYDDNGRLVKRTALRWQIFEVSLVTVPAVGSAVTLSMEGSNSMEVQQQKESALAGPPASAQAITLSVEQLSNVDGLLQIGRKNGLTENQTSALRTEVMSGAVHPDQIGAKILNALAQRDAALPQTRGHHSAQVIFDSRDSRNERMAEALACWATGKAPSEGAREYMSHKFIGTARECLESSGRSTRGLGNGRIVELALGGPHTTSDFPNIIGSAGQKVAINAYNATKQVFKPLAKYIPAQDYRPVTIPQISESPSLEKVNEGGEITHGTITDRSEILKVADSGRILTFSKAAMQNDDAGLFDPVYRFGSSGARREETQLRDLLTMNSGAGPVLTDNKNLFHTAHGNIAPVSAIGIDSLSVARKMLRLQRDLDGKTALDIEPRYLVVPAALESDGERFLASISAGTPGDVNPFSQRLSLVVSARLDEKSPGRWYVFGDVASAPVLAYSYLVGEEGIQISTREGWNVLGLEIRAVLTFGCGVLDHRGVVMNPGV